MAKLTDDDHIELEEILSTHFDFYPAKAGLVIHEYLENIEEMLDDGVDLYDIAQEVATMYDEDHDEDEDEDEDEDDDY